MSNFDISEYIILYVLDKFRDVRCCVAFLCKYSVACKVFEFIVENELAVTGIEIVRFNVRKVFGIDASSYVLVIRLSATGSIVDRCSVKDIDDRRVVYDIGFIGGKFYSRLTDVPDIDGACPFEWRQGIKHDYSSVMELKVVDNDFENKLGRVVSLEDDLLYPLLKSSSLKKAMIDSSDRRVIVTQHKLGEDTSHIRAEFPLLWEYLDTNRELFDKRKSRIYDKAPQFSLFGIGDYAFSKYKVAVSGFYKKALFCLVYSDKAIMLDDTCYYLSFDDFDSAYVTMLLLNTPIVEVFLNSIVLVDSKRPYTKKVLKRIDLAKVMDLVCYDDLVEVENKLCLDNYITEKVLDVYCSNYF